MICFYATCKRTKTHLPLCLLFSYCTLTLVATVFILCGAEQGFNCTCLILYFSNCVQQNSDTTALIWIVFILHMYSRTLTQLHFITKFTYCFHTSYMRLQVLTVFLLHLAEQWHNCTNFVSAVSILSSTRTVTQLHLCLMFSCCTPALLSSVFILCLAEQLFNFCTCPRYSVFFIPCLAEQRCNCAYMDCFHNIYSKTMTLNYTFVSTVLIFHTLCLY